MWVDAEAAQVGDDIGQAKVKWPDGSVSTEHVGKEGGKLVLYCSHRGHMFKHEMTGQGFQIENGEAAPPADQAAPAKQQAPTAPAPGQASLPQQEQQPPPAAQEGGKAFTPDENAADPNSAGDDKPRRVRVSK